MLKNGSWKVKTTSCLILISSNEDVIDTPNVYNSSNVQRGVEHDNSTQTRDLGPFARRLAMISKQILVLLKFKGKAAHTYGRIYEEFREHAEINMNQSL